ncbi:glycosyltransferase [Vibrio fluvialis]|uniref:glycosyltransferase n=1 Tax=Vibrio fluvialis TaxID=676 RepID=UPI0005C8E2EE|nr:glycosyltransferase [Vibrio fluvialis]
MNDKIAVIMSVYRADDPVELERAVKSMLEQTLKADVFLYCDGPLGDDLNKVVAEFKKRNHIHVEIGEINLGLAHALNILIDLVLDLDEGYEYIARMDSDDWSHPERLKEQVKYLEENAKIDVCGTFCKEVGATYALNEKKLPTNHEELFRFSVLRCPFIHPTVVFRRRVFEANHRYPTDTHLTEDMALWFTLLISGFKFGNVDLVLLEYTLRESTIYRRAGIDKGFSEFKARLNFMFATNQISLKAILGIFGRLVFHVLPKSLIKLLYMKAR